MSPRYPEIHVRVRSRNPLALVGAVRMELRRAGIGPLEIHRFSNLAMACPSSTRLQQICGQWVRLDAPRPTVANGAPGVH